MSSIHEEELATATALVAEEDDERGYKILEYHLIVKNAKGGEEVSSGSIGGFDSTDRPTVLGEMIAQVRP